MCIEENVPILLEEEEEADIDFGLDINNDNDENENLNERRNRVNPDLIAGRRLRQRLIQNVFA